MRCPPKRNILSRAVWAMAGVTLLVGTLVIGITWVVTNHLAQQEANNRLGELLDTIEETVRIACFIEDAQLATEVARGLIRNSEVAAVSIRSLNQELGREERSGQLSQNSAAALRRDIYSPFDPTRRVGEIELQPNREALEQRTFRESLFVGLVLAAQLALLTLAVIFIVLRLIVAPIKAISDRLHLLKPTLGERLPAPPGHGGNEIGRLVDDINGLTEDLVAALEEEHSLRLRQAMDERKYRDIFENAESGIFVADGQGTLLSHNRSLARLSGQEERPGGMPPNLLALPWGQPEQTAALLRSCLESNSAQEDDLELALPDNPRWLHLSLTPIGDALVQGIASDITQRKLVETFAQRMTVTDLLTSLGNRMGLEQQIREMIILHPEQPFALLLINLDGFKRINDGQGFDVGNELLLMAANRLRNCIKGSDWLGRTSGDEFALLLPNVEGQEIPAKVAHRIVETLGLAYELGDTPAFVGSSVGIALYPEDGRELLTLLRNAELALDRVKRSGGRDYQFFHPSMAAAAENRRRLENELRLAAERQELRLFYQPIVDIQQNHLAGAEALIRWVHPQQGMVPPDDFIPVAEETGLIQEIGLWVLETACDQLQQWRREGRGDLYLSINVSGSQIPHGLPPSAVVEALSRRSLPPGALVLEITEGVLMSDMKQALEWLQALRQVGIRIYLDDFGTGYSSLSYLKRFPVTTVKVDKSFVRDMGQDSSDRALVEAIVAMTRSLGLEVVAEGVENEAQLALLRGMGTRYGQGYHFSRPVPAGNFSAVAERLETLLQATPGAPG